MRLLLALLIVLGVGAAVYGVLAVASIQSRLEELSDGAH